MRAARLVLSLCVLSIPAACDSVELDEVSKDTGSSATTSDGGSGDGGSGDGGTTEEPDPETECDDGLDNDEDGATDCDDTDCAEFEPCTWPTSMAHTGIWDFAANADAECETFIGNFDIDINSCLVDYSATLTEVTDSANQCPTCDRTFYGTFTYNTDTCSGALGFTPPTDAYFGFIFDSDSEWRLVGRSDTGEWEAEVAVPVAGGQGTFSTTEAINVEDDRCDNTIFAGDLTISWTFAPN